jgi:hypothetical protein
MELVNRKRYYGFENDLMRKFIKLTFYSLRGFKSMKYSIEKTKWLIAGIQGSLLSLLVDKPIHLKAIIIR